MFKLVLVAIISADEEMKVLLVQMYEELQKSEDKITRANKQVKRLKAQNQKMSQVLRSSRI